MELLIVLAVLGLSLTLVIPRFGGALESARIKAALRDTSDLFRKARAQSVLKRLQTSVKIYPKRGEFELVVPVPANQDKEAGESTKSVSLPEGLSITTLQMNMLSKKKVKSDDEKPKEILFYPSGNCSGGHIEIEDKKKRIFSIDINPFNGKVVIVYAS